MRLNEDLFEEMRVRLGCMYISDMRFIADKERIRRVYESLPKDAYDERQRTDFERYALGS